MSESRALTPTTDMGAIEKVLVGGDLGKLSPEQRQEYYLAVCNSLGLNPLTQPFSYITLQGKLTLYARRDCAEQLRKNHKVSLAIDGRERLGELYIVTARATMPDGRYDMSTGVVNLGNLGGEALANALMKAETKAKRRVTLSICGLGFLDETEAEAIPNATIEPVTPTVVVEDAHWIDDPKTRERFWAWARNDMGLTEHEIYQALRVDSVHKIATKQEALDRIDAYLRDRQEAEPTDAEQEAML